MQVSVGRVQASRNILLARLSRADQALIEPYVQECTLACGASLIGTDELLEAVFFPSTALVTLEDSSQSESSVEVALIGREGMLGWPALLGCERSSHAARVSLRAGTVLRVPLAPLRLACNASPSLHAALLQFVNVMFVQLARAIACSLQHTLHQRLARWLLMRHDRLAGDVVVVNHDHIAGSMNVRRASVTDGLHVLEGQRLVHSRRGRVVIRDRRGLETFAGGAYGTAEAEYRLLIAPFGKTSPC